VSSNYTAGQIRDIAELKEVIERVNNELKDIERAFASELRLPTLSAEPERPRDGTVAYAEGVAWDPGGGEGIYAYFNGAWSKLETGSFQPADAMLDDLAALTDPGIDAAVYWNEGSNALDWLEKASVAEVQAHTDSKFITPAHLTTASALETLTETAGAVAVSWTAFINGTVTVDQATVISNPTGGVPGTYRTILVKGNDATDRVITFDTQFLGEVPAITDCDSARWYMLTIMCITSTHFVVSSKRALG